MKIEFDWRSFSEGDLKNANASKIEDDIFGYAECVFNGSIYVIDIHHEYYGSKDKCFDLEIYRSSENVPHAKWLGSIKKIKTAANYRRFCRRAEDVIIRFLVNRPHPCGLSSYGCGLRGAISL